MKNYSVVVLSSVLALLAANTSVSIILNCIFDRLFGGPYVFSVYIKFCQTLRKFHGLRYIRYIRPCFKSVQNKIVEYIIHDVHDTYLYIEYLYARVFVLNTCSDIFAQSSCFEYSVGTYF